MLMALRGLLGVLGVSAVLIALSIFVFGPANTAWTFERAFDAVSGYRGPLGPAWPRTMDSELRFYAPFWGAYGVLLILTARDIAAHMRRVPWLAAVFFLGGVGRAISYVAVGAPHPFFVVLMAVELGSPPLLIGLWLAARRRPTGPKVLVDLPAYIPQLLNADRAKTRRRGHAQE